MRDEAQAVIIGGGVTGCSIAYHLTQMGWRDIVLVDRGALTGGSTHRAAGLIGQLRGTYNLTRMIMYSVELYGRLRAETGIDPDWLQVGSIRLASSALRMEEIRRMAAQAKAFGLEVELLTPRKALELCPIIGDRDLVGGAYIPTDGRIDPSGLTYALAHGARSRGCEIHAQTAVTGIDVRNGRVHAVTTTQGTIRTPIVVCASGVWSWHVGRLVGVAVPIVPVEHHYMMTAPFGVPRNLPTFRDPDLRIYGREEVRGLLVGGYEGNPVRCGPEPIPADLDPVAMVPNWDRFETLARNAAVRITALSDIGVRKLMIGPETFTPDGDLLLGESAEVRGFFVAGGTPGIAAAGGVGKAMAEWIIDGRPTLDLWRADIRRFGRHYADRSYAATRAVEVYARNYTVHLPLEEFESARRLRTSPPYDRLVALGAVFGEKAGWERPNWFQSNANGESNGPAPGGWIRHNWSPAIAAEHLATREHAGIFDFSSFSKFEVQGRGALSALQWLTDNDMDKPPGAVTYTQMLNPRGGVECDVTITRLGPDHFFIVTGSAFGIHDFAWIRAHLPEDGSVQARDVTTEFACIGLWGPRARDILQSVTETDLSNDTFPYMTFQSLDVAGAEVRALRVTYVGELGWELYMPIARGLSVWDALWEAGQPLGLRPVGYRAVDSLRLEKGYRYWSADVTPDYTPYEAGQGFCVKLDRKDFLGKQALLTQRERGLTRKLCCLVLDDRTVHPLGNEPLISDGRVISRTTSGGIGYTVGESIAYAYLPLALAGVSTEVAVEIDGRRVPARVEREPRFDPTNTRIKA